MNGTGEYHGKQSAADSGREVSHVFFHMWKLVRQTKKRRYHKGRQGTNRTEEEKRAKKACNTWGSTGE